LLFLSFGAEVDRLVPNKLSSYNIKTGFRKLCFALQNNTEEVQYVNDICVETFHPTEVQLV
jgi:hypothetical protein